jgi:hypothetical protein
MSGELRAPFWTFFWMIVGFKVATSIAIFVMMPTAHNAIFQLGMNWYVFLPALVVVLLPTVFWFRLLRVRAKRRKLIRAEWNVEPEPTGIASRPVAQ